MKIKVMFAMAAVMLLAVLLAVPVMADDAQALPGDAFYTRREISEANKIAGSEINLRDLQNFELWYMVPGGFDRQTAESMQFYACDNSNPSVLLSNKNPKVEYIETAENSERYDVKITLVDVDNPDISFRYLLMCRTSTKLLN